MIPTSSFPADTALIPVFALVFVGTGVLLIFLQTLNFIVDAYVWVANSAIAGWAVCRGLAGAGFPLFTTQM